MSRILISLLLVSSLAACAGGPEVRQPMGSLSLEMPVSIPPGAATLRLQYGRVTAFNAVQEQDPFCVFELETVSDRPQAVAPATFPITAMSRSVETFAGMPVLPFHVVRVSMGQDDGGPSQIYYKTTFRLAPNPQGARSLACMSNQYMPGIAIMRHLSLGEMRQALGAYFTLDLSGTR
jgi:hypothetical protein